MCWASQDRVEHFICPVLGHAIRCSTYAIRTMPGRPTVPACRAWALLTAARAGPHGAHSSLCRAGTARRSRSPKGTRRGDARPGRAEPGERAAAVRGVEAHAVAAAEADGPQAAARALAVDGLVDGLGRVQVLSIASARRLMSQLSACVSAAATLWRAFVRATRSIRSSIWAHT